MGIPLSKVTEHANEPTLEQKVNRARESLSEMIQEKENMSLSRRTQNSFHHPYYHHHRHEPREEVQEEKCGYVEWDLMNLSMVISNMFHDQGRRFCLTTAVHPIDGRTNPSPIIERLPPPVHEVKKVPRGSSIPVRCPNSTCHTEDDIEYLSKLYDLKTWAMYTRITESRRNRRILYRPTMEEKPVIDEQQQDITEEEGEEEDHSLESNMIFAFDLE